MNSRSNTLSVDNIQTMSMSDIVNAYSNGYRLDTKIQGLDIGTWFGEESCVGTEPNQTCIGNKYLVGIGGIVALILLTR